MGAHMDCGARRVENARARRTHTFHAMPVLELNFNRYGCRTDAFVPRTGQLSLSLSLSLSYSSRPLSPTHLGTIAIESDAHNVKWSSIRHFCGFAADVAVASRAKCRDRDTCVHRHVLDQLGACSFWLFRLGISSSARSADPFSVYSFFLNFTTNGMAVDRTRHNSTQLQAAQ